jgi:predicted TIM-barrel fold metal-dependent hydrolase
MGYEDNGPAELQPVGETRFAASQAQVAPGANHRVAAAILGAADLALGDAVRPVLEAHIEAGGGRFRGVRTRAVWDSEATVGYGAAGAPEGLLQQASFQEGVKCLGSLGLTFDVWAFHTQLEDVAKLAMACPNVPIVLDHVGGPLGVGRFAGKRDEVFAAWSAGIVKLARCSNVHVKLGGGFFVGFVSMPFRTTTQTIWPGPGVPYGDLHRGVWAGAGVLASNFRSTSHLPL